MIKSEERNTEYFVILRPRYREHPPICMRGWAKNEEDAMNGCFNSDWHKEVLDARTCSEMEWNQDTIKHYWDMYGTYVAEKATVKVKLF